MVGRRALGKHDMPERVLSLFPVLKTMLRRRGGDLSGGQQQQLAMGRALALDPKLLILDEPTEGIREPNIVAEIGDVITRLREEGVTVLLVEQKLAFARRVRAQLRDSRSRSRGRVGRDRRADRRPGSAAPDRMTEGTTTWRHDNRGRAGGAFD